DRTSDHCLGRRHPIRIAMRWETVVCEQGECTDANCRAKSQRTGHLFAPVVCAFCPAGISSSPFSSLAATFLSAPGSLKLKVSAAIAVSVFQLLMRKVYCGAPAI